MKPYIKIVMLCLFLIQYVWPVLAAPIHGEKYYFAQPDGSLVEVYVWGDEYYQHVESSEGYTLIRDPESKYICYAQKDSDGLLYSSEKIYNGSNIDTKSALSLKKHLRADYSHVLSQVEERKHELNYDKLVINTALNTKSTRVDGLTRNSIGIIKGITILIDFSDSPAVFSKTQVYDLLNKKGYTEFNNNGSVNEYFNDISGGKLNYTNDVIGYYRAPETKWYYDNPDLVGYEKVDELLRAILDSATQDFNFGLLSREGAYLIAINFMYAGAPSAGWGKGLWPHAGFLGKQVDGVGVGPYQISRMTNELNIGTFCHETGHTLLNLPDLYDYDGNSSGVGAYDIMAVSDDKNPAPLNPFFRDLCNWETIFELEAHEQVTEMYLPANANYSIRRAHPFLRNEFYYIENKIQRGRSLTAPDEGLLIWHIDFNGNNSFEDRNLKKHYYVSVVQADNKFDLEKNRNNGDDTDLFHEGHNSRFSWQSSPAALWWDGSESVIDIRDIGPESDTMYLKIMGFNEPSIEPVFIDSILGQGLDFKMIKGEFKMMPDFSEHVTEITGLAKNLNVNFSGLYNNYALAFSGYLKVPETDMYEFTLSSDDGSMLYLNDRLVINNTQALNGGVEDLQLWLSAGYYRFKLEYFQYNYNLGLHLFWKNSNTGLKKIPDNAFFRIQEATALAYDVMPQSTLRYRSESQSFNISGDPIHEYHYYIYNTQGVLLHKGFAYYNTDVYSPLGRGLYLILDQNGSVENVHKLLVP